jgi:hypothetical protein
MVITIGISGLIGAALGFRFNAFILIAAVVLGVATTASIGMIHADQMSTIILTMVAVITALQVSYLGGAIARAAAAEVVGSGGSIDVREGLGYEANPRSVSLFKLLDIQERMEVVGSDGHHVGTVDHKEINGVILTKDDPKTRGKPHLILVDWVDYVDSKVHLNKPSEQAVLELAA